MGPLPLLGADEDAEFAGEDAYAALEEAEDVVLAELAHVEADELADAASTS